VQDLEMEVRERGRQVDGKDLQLESLRNQLRSAETDIQEIKAIHHEEVKNLKRELLDRGQEVDELRQMAEESQEAAHKKGLAEIRQSKLEEKRKAAHDHDQELAEMRQSMIEEKRKAAEEHEQELADTRQSMIKDRRKVANKHEQELANLEDEMLVLEASLQDTISELTSKLQANVLAIGASKRQLEIMEAELVRDQKRYSVELSATRKQHDKELKGLAKQIQYLHAKCYREEGFRNDLVYTKNWFLMQVHMYQQW